MKIIRFLLVLGVVLTPSAALCKIGVAKTMQEIQTAFEQSTGETLGLFDIDMVLVQPSVPAFQMTNMKQHKPALKALLEPLSQLEKDMTLMLILQQGHTILVEPQTPSIVANIHKKTPKLIALTSTLTGQWDKIQDGVLFRAEQLKSVGINFASSFPTVHPITFNHMKAYRDHYPEFKQGVLAANGEQKGATLVAFLKYVNYKPNAIIFIDDRESNIQDVEKALSAHYPNIRFTGIHYKGAERFTTQIIDEHSFRAAWSKEIQKAKEILH